MAPDEDEIRQHPAFRFEFQKLPKCTIMWGKGVILSWSCKILCDSSFLVSLRERHKENATLLGNDAEAAKRDSYESISA